MTLYTKRYHYYGYGDETDSEGKVTNTNVLKAEAEAADARTYVDPDKVRAALDKLEAALNGSGGGVKKIQNEIKNVSVEAGGEMLIVRDSTMEPVINAVAEEMDQIWPQVSGTLQDFQNLADTEFNNKQNEYNQEAYDDVSQASGVKWIDQKVIE